MLVLTRRHGESIIINNNIKVTVISKDNETMVLGIDAPRHVPIDREEIHIKKQKNVEAA